MHYEKKQDVGTSERSFEKQIWWVTFCSETTREDSRVRVERDKSNRVLEPFDEMFLPQTELLEDCGENEITLLCHGKITSRVRKMFV